MGSDRTGEVLKSGDAAVVQEGERLKASVMLKIHEKELEAISNAGREGQISSKGQEESVSDQAADETILSEDYQVYDRRSAQGKSGLSQAEARLDEMWAILENWVPSADRTLTEELHILRLQYEQILKEILENYDWKETQRLLSLLDSQIARLLQFMEDSKFPSLQSFLEHHGEKAAETALKAALFRAVTGRSISPKEMAKMGGSPLGPRHGGQGIHSQASHTADRGRNGQSLSQEGLLYNRNSPSTVKANAVYQEHVKSAAWASLREIHSSKGENVPRLPAFLKGNGTAREIELAERFAEYISREGGLWASPSLNAENEELLGFLMAETMIKAQVFHDYSGVGKEIGKSLLDAAEQFLYFTLAEKCRTCQTYDTAGIRNQLNQKDVWHIYHAVMNFFYKYKNPQEALARGLSYALGRFSSKKSSEEYKRLGRYGENAGFFRNYSTEKELQKDVGMGVQTLERDWEEFLTTIGQRSSRHLQLTLPHSPWGLAMDSQGPAQNLGSIPPWAFLAASVAVVVLVFLLKAL